MTLAIGFIGYGEVGQLFARELTARGCDVFVYDILFETGRGAAMRGIARPNGVTPCASLADLCSAASLVIAAVTADAALAAARDAAGMLTPRHTYIDLNSVSPQTKRDIAAVTETSGAAFVEFAVMGPVAEPKLAVQILAGGRDAAEVAARLNLLGMRITALGEEIGTASATKLCRSIVIKGMEALMVDLSLAAPKAGVMEAVIETLDETYPGMDWAGIARAMPQRVARHGIRRAAEMREAAAMIRELGFDGSLAEAIAARHETFARENREETQPRQRARSA